MACRFSGRFADAVAASALLLIVPALALLRDVVAQAAGRGWAGIEAAGYGALLPLAAVLVWRLDLDLEALGFAFDRLPIRLAGAGALGLVLTFPALAHGVALERVIPAIGPSFAVATIEELLFHGLLLATARRAFGAPLAVLATSASFAAAHAAVYSWPALLLAAIVAALLGVWRLAADDLVGPILAHALADAVAAGALAA